MNLKPTEPGPAPQDPGIGVCAHRDPQLKPDLPRKTTPDSPEGEESGQLQDFSSDRQKYLKKYTLSSRPEA
jgi:hypothetical protein